MQANALDQYGAVSTSTPTGTTTENFQYDANGNMTADGQGRAYTYNSENQLIRAIGPGFNMEYLYDALGRRSQSLDHLNPVNGKPYEIYHMSLGDEEIEDYVPERRAEKWPPVFGHAPRQSKKPPNAAGKVTGWTPVSLVILGAGVDERLGWHHLPTDDMVHPLTNHQGSTVGLVGRNGRLKAQSAGGVMTYDAYGNDTVGVPASAMPYRYTGRRLDVNTGLYYYRARYYDPRHGRFLQTDPIGTADQMNLYAYVWNDPVNQTDPSQP